MKGINNIKQVKQKIKTQIASPGKGKSSVERCIAELYPGKNGDKLYQDYCNKKRKDLQLLVLAAGAICLLLFLKAIMESMVPDNVLIRPDYGKGEQVWILQGKEKGEGWQDIPITLSEREYTEEEIGTIFAELEDRLPEIILGENSSLEAVQYPLQLPDQSEKYPVTFVWVSSDSEYLHSDGTLGEKEPEGSTIVELSVTMICQQSKEEFVFPICRIPPTLTPEEAFWKKVSAGLKGEEEKTRQESQMVLPQEFQEVLLKWRKKPDTAGWIFLLLAAIVIPLISLEKDREWKKKTVIRRTILKHQYPEFISKLMIFLEAGMSVRSALFRIVELKETIEEEEYLYLELQYLCFQMKNGMSEKEAYDLFGKRCGIPLYRKLSSLLVQNLQKGGKGLLDTLRIETAKAFEERKNQIRKKGEEAGTKLLFPMMIMLSVVMILIMVPAMFSFM